MSEGGIEDAVVKNPVALWSASNDDEEEEDEEEHLAISGTNPLESNGVLTPYLDNENNALQLFQRTSDANQVIGDVNIESSNNVHIGHVFKTIVQGDIQNSSPVNQETNGYCKKVRLGKKCKIILFCGVLGLMLFLTLSSSKDDDQHPPDVNKPIDRKTCGLSPSQNPIAVDQIEYIVVDHSGGEQCFDLKSCCKRVLDIQRRDVNEDGLADIRYNFLIGTDGTIYQGRGFEHANDMSPRTLNVAMIGDFTEKRAPNAMMEAVNWLVLLGLGKSPMAVGTMDIICYNQIRSIGNQRTDDSQLCRDIANSDSIRMYYADAILNITDGRIYPD